MTKKIFLAEMSYLCVTATDRIRKVNYYNIKVVPQTRVKVIKFKLLKNL